MTNASVIIVGGGASGLAVAADLLRRGIEPVVLDAGDRVGGSWARRYDRLHLHTVRRFSGLPFLPMPRTLPRYVSKNDYADYLARYARELGIDVQLGQRVEAIRRDGDGWTIQSQAETRRARAVVVATGRHGQPSMPEWTRAHPFRGKLMHADEYRSAAPFNGMRMLVAGLGNSGAEIAAELADAGAASVTVAVRSVPPISKREIAGVPVQVLGMVLAPLPSGVVDRAGSIARRRSHGDLRPYGLGAEAWGPFGARRPPVIDTGFVAHLKAGRIAIRPAVTALTGSGATFADGQNEPFDAVICATGYTTGLPGLVKVPAALDARGMPTGAGTGIGLFFAGFAESPRGQLFESSRAAKGLAAAITRYLEGEAP